VDPAGSPGEKRRLPEVVIDALDEDVLEGDLLFLVLVPCVEGPEEILQRPTAVDGQEEVADFVGGAVQRNRKADLAGMGGESPDLGDEAGGRDGEVPRPDFESPRGRDQIDGVEEVFEVCQRLAHSHEDEVVNPLAGELLGPHDLACDLVGGQVSGEAVEPGSAEFAAECAADLRGDTEGPAVGGLSVEGRGGRDEHAFDELSVVEPEEELTGRVGRALGADVSEFIEAEARFEFGAQGGGKVAHGCHRADALFPDPVQDLAGAVVRFARLGQKGEEIVPALAAQ